MTPTENDLIQFVVQECRLLDEEKFMDWLELFTEDGIYWMPLERWQTEEKLTTSLLYEDYFLLTVRVRRLADAYTFSQHPKSRGQHTLQTPTVDQMDEAKNEYLTFTPFQFVEYRNDHQDFYAGWMKHTLTVQDGALKMRMKRIDLVNCDAPHGNIQLLI